MRKRFQRGSLQKLNGFWIGRWYEDGRRRARTLGRVSAMTKTQALAELAGVLAPVNRSQSHPSKRCSFGDFLEQVFLPFYRRKWKRSTVITSEDRIVRHLIGEFGPRKLETITRDQLQNFLDRKAADGYSHGMVSHLRWDLKQSFTLAIAEGILERNPAAMLFIPREARRQAKRVMIWEEVGRAVSCLELRERLIVKLALFAGMRPGEIFGLRWGRMQDQYAQVEQRVYKGEVDSPKTATSVRKVALSDGLLADVAEWRRTSIDTRPDAWVFPSETIRTPLSKENCWQRYMAPKLKAAGLGWVNFQVMRRTHSSLMSELGVDPKIVAEQLGHSVDVNLNVYTQAALDRRRKAVNAFEAAHKSMPAA